MKTQNYFLQGGLLLLFMTMNCVAEAKAVVEQYIGPHQKLTLGEEYSITSWWLNGGIIIGLGLAIIGLVTYLKTKHDVLYYRQKLQHISTNFDEQVQREVEKEVTELKELLFEKDQAMTVLSLQILEKNKQLVSFKEKLKGLQSIITNPELKREFPKLIRNMHWNINLEKDWKVFQEQFKLLNPLFFKKLREINTQLTNNDLKYCAYLRMYLPIKTTATLMSVSPQAVKMARNRIKKKLGLGKTDKLLTFLNQL